MMTAPALVGLRDVDDVHGSFLLGWGGELLGRDLPAVFRDELFSDVGPRLARLRETLETNGQVVGTLVLRFSEHKLHVRAVGERLLCVITGAKVNAPALRMAMNLVARHVELTPQPPTVRPGHSRGPAAQRPGAPAPGPTLPSASPPVVGHRREVLYRGRRPG